MKQKLVIMLFTACMALSCTFALAACNDTPTADNGNGDAPHEHSYVDGVCTECGAPEPQPTEGLVFTLSEDEMEYAVTRYRGAATEVYIPATYEGLPVTSIGMSAFQLCRSLTSVIIPDSITSIGEWAFSNCSNLTSITIPDSVTSIGMSAFQECSSLTSITIPDSVTSIELMAFYNCSSLTSITIPDSVISIGSEAFSGCSSLTSVTIPESVTSIGRGAFTNCDNLTSVTFENTEGWSVEGWDGQINNIDVTDPAQNVVYLTDTYRLNVWTRSE